MLLTLAGDVIGIAGAASITIGCWFISPIVGLLAGGVIAIIIGALLHARAASRP